MDPVDAINELLEEIKIDSSTETDEPPTQAHHAEGSADKSIALELRHS